MAERETGGHIGPWDQMVQHMSDHTIIGVIVWRWCC